MLPMRSGTAVLENFFVDDGEAIARLDVEHEVDVVLENFGEIERDAIARVCASAAAWKRELLNGRAGGARADLERILEHVAD